MVRLPSRFDRDRAFYPTVTIIVASYYVLFAAIGGSLPVVLFEAAFMLVFVSAAGREMPAHARPKRSS